MATKKKPSPGAGAVTASNERYEQAQVAFGQALESLRKGDYENARSGFEALIQTHSDEPAMLDRASSYIRICEQRLAPPPAEISTAEDRYNRAVLLMNQGETEHAIRLLDDALRSEPSSPAYLYARASAWALQGNTAAAVTDLSQAINIDPQWRYQAVNDADFELIREEQSFIDIVEPRGAGSSSGA